MAQAIPFPDTQPDGYSWLNDEPIFDPATHLAIEHPDHLYTLSDLGYDPVEVATKATPFAISSPFRILSEAGAAALLHVTRQLRTHQRPAGDRIQHTVRGGCYRSRFLRDLCLSDQVTDVMSAIYGCDIAPHPMVLQLGHLNYEPDQINEAVDKWHHDTIPLDYVMMVTDPKRVSGGAFEYFLGTKHEAAEMASRGERPHGERVIAADIPGPGYAVALHGDMVVHRAAPLTERGERITMVNAYVATDTTRDAQSRTRDLIAIDDPTVLYAEWARLTAWRAQGRLAALQDSIRFGTPPEEVITRLEHAIADVTQAIDDMRAGARDAQHYER
jgi:hypothetical protein